MIKIILTLFLVVFLPLLYIWIDNGKYDFDFVQDENGVWNMIPIFHPCSEPIDEEWIKEWHRKEKLYKAQYKR